MQIPKRVRVKNRKLLDKYHDMPCIVCGWPQSEPAHIRSKAAGGGDEPDNLINFCQKEHRTQHQKGWKYMWDTYAKVKQELIKKGWAIDQHGRLFRV